MDIANDCDVQPLSERNLEAASSWHLNGCSRVGKVNVRLAESVAGNASNWTLGTFIIGQKECSDAAACTYVT